MNTRAALLSVFMFVPVASAACDDADPADPRPADTVDLDTAGDDDTAAPPGDTTGPPGDTRDPGDSGHDTDIDTAPGDTADASDEDTAVPAPLLDLYELEGDRLFPESVAWDPVTRAFFVGSLEHGNVTRIEGDGSGQSEFYPGYSQDGWLTLGVEVDPMRRRLWVCATFGADMVNPTVWVLDVDTAELLREIQLTSVAAGSACNDFVIDESGVAYASNREGPDIFRIDADRASNQAEVWASDPLLEPETFGLNAVALSADGRTLLAGKYNPPRLIRIPLDDPTDVAEVELDVDISMVTSGLDGMILFPDGRLYGTFEVEVIRFTAGDADWNTATVERATIEQDGEPVTGWAGITEAEGELYILKSDVVRFALGAAPELPFRILRFGLEAFDAAP